MLPVSINMSKNNPSFAKASKGKLIVFEGADGSGKTTQAKLLVSFLKYNKISNSYISFPRYEESLWGRQVSRYLHGDFGKLNEVDPYFASMLYAGDRMSASAIINKWLNDGKVVVCNRYIGSNIAHMAGKLRSPAKGEARLGRQSEKSKFIKWLEELEYEENRIPNEDLVIFLYVPVGVSRKLIKNRKLDIHEADLNYLGRVLDVYELYARSHKNWVKVDCTDGGQILPKEEIHKKVLEVLEKRKIL